MPTVTPSFPEHTAERTWRPLDNRQLLRWTLASYACLGGALLLVVGISIWGVRHDLEQIRASMIQSEMGRLRSHALRTVGRIQAEIMTADGGADISALADNKYLRDHWNTYLKLDESRLYAAIVDPEGVVAAHSNPTLQGGQCETFWYDALVREAGDDVVDTRHQPLTGGARAINVRAPIYDGERVVAYYNSGLRYEWFAAELARRQAATVTTWTVILSLIAGVVVAAGLSLLAIARRIAWLAQSIKLGRAQRFAELGQLLAGMVHEIRNPLNAMRLNLHVLARQAQGILAAQPISPDHPEANTAEIIRETNHEIERVEGLLRVVLGFARPDQPHNERLDLRHEVQTSLTFLRPLLERADVLVKFLYPETALYVHMDRDRLRQVLLNLLNNAKEAMEQGGQITLQLTSTGQVVELRVADEGVGVKAADRERIFEPFFTTKALGAGLGLALVRRFVEEVGGAVRCEANHPHGAVFCLRLPKASRTAGAEP